MLEPAFVVPTVEAPVDPPLVKRSGMRRRLGVSDFSHEGGRVLGSERAVWILPVKER